MKLSFSTKGWHNSSFEEFCATAVDLKFEGIELHNIHNRLFTDKDGAFHDYTSAQTLRKLYELKLSIPCVDSICDCAKPEEYGDTIQEIKACMNIAKNLKIPAVRIRAKANENTEKAFENIKNIIEEVISEAESNGITLLVETSGIFCDTALLLELLNTFACDNLAALWDMYSTFFIGKEDAETTIKNLGAYVRHVHIKDAIKENGITTGVRIGDGAVDYKGMIKEFITSEYNGAVIFEPHYKPGLVMSEELLRNPQGSQISAMGDIASKECILSLNEIINHIKKEIEL